MLLAGWTLLRCLFSVPVLSPSNLCSEAWDRSIYRLLVPTRRHSSSSRGLLLHHPLLTPAALQDSETECLGDALDGNRAHNRGINRPGGGSDRREPRILITLHPARTRRKLCPDDASILSR